MLRLRLFVALNAQRTILAQDDKTFAREVLSKSLYCR